MNSEKSMPKMPLSAWRLFIFSACSLALFGCGPKLPSTARVVGKVTFEGKPITSGQIAFYPEKGRPATGAIRSDGSYVLTTVQPNDGAMLGKHRVTIEAVESPSDVSNRPASFEEELRGTRVPRRDSAARSVRWIVPEKYARRDTSPLRVEVKPGANTCDFNL